jgi:phospholipase/carboxylesterase
MSSAPLLVHDLVVSGTPTRWVMVLHGLGDSKEGWKPVADYLALPVTGWIFVQAPDCYYDGWSWFDLRLPDPLPDYTQVLRSRTRLRELLTHLEATRGIACENLTLMGFSQGCLMTMEVGLTHERPFAGLVGISGWVANIEAYPGAFGTAADQQRIFMTHGTADQVIPIAVTRPQARRLQGLGLDLTWREYAKAHGLDTESELGEIRDFILGADAAL